MGKFTDDDKARLGRILDLYNGGRVDWGRHKDQFEQSLASVKVKASLIRRARERERSKTIAKSIRFLEKATTIRQSIREAEEVRRPRNIPLDSHLVNTSTQAFQFRAEILNRIGAQGITAGLLGDPPPGRSALDKITNAIDPMRPTLPAKLSRDIRLRRTGGARHKTDKPQPAHT